MTDDARVQAIRQQDFYCLTCSVPLVGLGATHTHTREGHSVIANPEAGKLAAEARAVSAEQALEELKKETLARGGKPEIREHGDLPHRKTGDSFTPVPERCLCEIHRHDFNCPIHNDRSPERQRGPNGDE